MKKAKSILLLIIVLSFPLSQAFAQFGIKGGATLSSFDTEITGNGMSFEESSDTKFGFQAGILYQHAINDMISIQPELLFTQKGGKDDVNGGLESKVTLSYVEVPVLLRFNVPIDGDIRPYLIAGPHAGYLLDAKDEYDGESEDISDFLEDLNFGLTFGGGVQFGNFFVDARYDLGLSNVFDESSIDEPFDITNKINGFIITAGITF